MWMLVCKSQAASILFDDGVILCSQGVGIQPYHLMTTTLPYAIIAGGITKILYLTVGFFIM